MAASGGEYRCGQCGWLAPKWVGRCGRCQEWDSVSQVEPPPRAAATAVTQAARPLPEIDPECARGEPTGVDELDRVLGGGLVPGSVVLLAGEPGVGKSTLLLQVAGAVAGRGVRCLYVTGEESAEQVRARAGRVGAVVPGVLLAAEVRVGAVVAQVEAVGPRLLIVDSVQTMLAEGVEGAASGVSHVRQAAADLIRLGKERAMAVILVGHVTKDGGIAGPRTLEHLVDVVLSFEGDRHARLRTVRAVKNRFGPTDEVGCFELGEMGLTGVADPSGLFVSTRRDPVPGTCLTVGVDGRRPMLAEVQALVVPSAGGAPRRTASGVAAPRVAMVLAVLERREMLPLSHLESYVAPVGGARLVEPAADLALALALYGSVRDMAVPMGWVGFGEIGLAGDLRSVPAARRRVAEAERLGMTDVVLPRADVPHVAATQMRIHPADDLSGALRIVPWARPDIVLTQPAGGPRSLMAVPDP